MRLVSSRPSFPPLAHILAFAHGPPAPSLVSSLYILLVPPANGVRACVPTATASQGASGAINSHPNPIAVAARRCLLSDRLRLRRAARRVRTLSSSPSPSAIPRGLATWDLWNSGGSRRAVGPLSPHLAGRASTRAFAGRFCTGKRGGRERSISSSARSSFPQQEEAALVHRLGPVFPASSHTAMSSMHVDQLLTRRASASEQSSSSLSPPPTTPQHADTIRVAPRAVAAVPAHLQAGIPAEAANTAAAYTLHGSTTTFMAAPANGAAPEKPKRQRKKKALGPDGQPIDDGKPKDPNKKTRKPREPKDKAAAAAASAASAASAAGSNATAPRKRQKTEEKAAHDAPMSSRQPTLTEMVNDYQQSMQPTQHQPTMPPQPSQPRPQHRTSLSVPSNPPTPRPVSSGHYDPVRGYDPVRAATMETAQQRPGNTSNGVPSAHTSPPVNRASASPSIASLIDPPIAATKTSVPSGPPYVSQTTSQAATYVQPPPRSPTPPKPSNASFPQPPRLNSPLPPPATASKPATLSSHDDGAMDVDLTCDAQKPTIEIKAPSKASSSGPTPKPAAARPTPPPVKGTGSGLLSSSDLFGGPSSDTAAQRQGVTIDISIPLNPQGGNTINIAQEIVKKYGRDAINPRAAAHREQLLRIAAAANQIEGGSADDMSVDLDQEEGEESNFEMGGMDGDGAGTDGNAKPPVRRRRKKVEEYDKEDDFIDDTELAWQESAAVAKDGFFVYSGPLVPPGETANVESSAPSGRGGRGRGRGGGRGSRSAAGGANTPASSVDKKNADPNAPPPTAGRGRGRGRGTSAPRKSRITKADRERMEAEKIERERSAATATAPPPLGGPTGMPLNLGPPSTTTPHQPQHGYGGPQGTVA